MFLSNKNNNNTEKATSPQHGNPPTANNETTNREIASNEAAKDSPNLLDIRFQQQTTQQPIGHAPNVVLMAMNKLLLSARCVIFQIQDFTVDLAATIIRQKNTKLFLHCFGP